MQCCNCSKRVWDVFLRVAFKAHFLAMEGSRSIFTFKLFPNLLSWTTLKFPFQMTLD